LIAGVRVWKVIPFEASVIPIPQSRERNLARPAAAGRRFDAASLLAASSVKVRRSVARPASWPEQKRQRAAALQTNSPIAGRDEQEIYQHGNCPTKPELRRSSSPPCSPWPTFAASSTSRMCNWQNLLTDGSPGEVGRFSLKFQEFFLSRRVRETSFFLKVSKQREHGSPPGQGPD